MREVIEDELRYQAGYLAGTWLEAMGATGPPVPVYELAAHLGITVGRRVLQDGVLAERRRGKADGLDIVLNARPEGDPRVWRTRLRFALAHEVMALRLPQPAGELRPEGIYQACASELLLYRPWLVEAVRDLDWALPPIAALFAASHEATARAMAALDDCLLTIADNLQPTTRLATGAVRLPTRILPTEREALQRAYETWQAQETGDEWSRTRAWPVEPCRHVKRVIALTWPHQDAA